MSTQPKKNKKPIYVMITLVAVVIIVAAIIYFVVIKRKSSGSSDTELPGDSPTTSYSPAMPSYTPSSSSSGSSGGIKSVGNYAVLKQGDKAQEVRWVQYLFNSKIAGPYNVTPLSEDYIYGSKTANAVNKVLGKPTTTYAEWKNKLDSVFNSDTSASAAAQRALIIARLKS